MKPFRRHEGRGVPLRHSNVDTDQIVPASYLKRVTRTGFGDGCFAAWRTDPQFVLNQPQHEGASVLVAGPDFGTGSSREHAVWALQDYGFAAVVSSRFADIFRGNAGKAGLLTVEVDQAVVESLWLALEADPGQPVVVDLEARELALPSSGLRQHFRIDDYTRWRLLEGLDDIGLTERHLDAIEAFEARRPGYLPRTLPRLAEPEVVAPGSRNP
jgi:3-isopropylmalate/(R)-2-methylmalate dehydratase small subunit